MGGGTHQVELLLELLVCIVDAKLLKAVDVKRFKAAGQRTSRSRRYVIQIKHERLRIKKNNVRALPVNIQNADESVLLSRDL